MVVCAENWEEKVICQVPGPQLKASAYSPDGKYLLLHNSNGRIEIYDSATLKLQRLITPTETIGKYTVLNDKGKKL